MDLRRSTYSIWGSLILLNLLLAWGAIGLFTRMEPLIEKSWHAEVATFTWSEELLLQIAKLNELTWTPQTAKQLHEQVSQRIQLSSPRERELLGPLLHSLHTPPAWSPQLQQELAEQLEPWVRFQRTQSQSSLQEAHLLGQAGAWSAVGLSLLTLLLSLVLLARIKRTLILPLEELHQVLEESESGHRLRRCHPRPSFSEMQKIQERINRLLDLQLRPPQRAPEEPPK